MDQLTFTSCADVAWPECLAGRLVYHATPLHYLPSILSGGALLATVLLKDRGIEPRRTACRRDGMLGVTDFVHLAFDPVTPLVLDKVGRGYPHAILALDALQVALTPGAALLASNTKRWTARRGTHPITDPAAAARMIRTHFDFGRLPSLELLARYAVDLSTLAWVGVFTERDLDLVDPLARMLGAAAPRRILCDARVAGPESAYREDLAAYYAACLAAGRVLPPPRFSFD